MYAGFGTTEDLFRKALDRSAAGPAAHGASARRAHRPAATSAFLHGAGRAGPDELLRLARRRTVGFAARLTMPPVDLGFSLPQIAELGEDDHHPAEAPRTVDAELGATIERLQRARVELGLILRHHAPADLPADLAPMAGAAELSEADRSLVMS